MLTTIYQLIKPYQACIGSFFKIIVFAIIYYFSSQFGLLFGTFSVIDKVAPIWPAGGVGFAGLFIWGYWLWPGIFLGELGDLFLTGTLTIGHFLTAIGNTSALLLGTWSVRRFVTNQDLLSSSFHVLVFILFGALLTSLFSATVGVVVLSFSNVLPKTTLLTSWWIWCFSDIVGILVLVPIIITRFTHTEIKRYPARFVEVFFLLLSLGLTTWLVFGHALSAPIQNYPLTFLSMPILIWSAFQLSQRETLLIVLMLFVAAVSSTLEGLGPFVRPYFSPYESLLLLQTFMVVICVTLLFLLAVINERMALEASLRRAQDALENRVSERTQSLHSINAKLRETTEKYQSIFINAIEGIYQTSPEGKLLSANPALAQMYGYATPEEMMAQVKDIEKLYADPQRRAEFREYIDKIGKVYKFESTVYRKRGDIMNISENSRTVYNDRGKLLYYEGTMIDITDRKQAEEKLMKMAHYDALTGLANRRLFQTRLRQALAHAKHTNKTGILMYFDLDGFKQVNDTLGHEFGDELLKQVALRLKSCMRESDEVCRLGGDEFTVVAENVLRQQDAVSIAEKVLEVLNYPYSYHGRHANVGVSVGIAFFDGHNYDTDTLIRQADQAMYQAKQSGKGTYRFYAAD